MPPPKTIASDVETYDRISDAIAFIRQHHLEQPNLSTIAQHVNLSDYHFQRLFTHALYGFQGSVSSRLLPKV